MSDEQPFRLILLAAVVMLLPIGVYHRLKAHTGEALDRLQEGLVLLVSLRLFGVVLWMGLCAYLVNPAWMAWAAVPLPIWLRWLGAGLLFIDGLLLTWTLRNLGKNLTDTVVTRKEHTLVTTGPYRWVRHPFYCAALLAFLAISLVAANGFLFITGCVPALLLRFRTRKEEENLIARFGDAYRNYMQHTGRFVPRL